MHDIKVIRENPDIIRNDLRKRKDEQKIQWVDTLLEKDAQWRKLKGDTDQLRSKRNKLSEEINQTKKQGRDIKHLLEEVKLIPQRIKEHEDLMVAIEKQIRDILMQLPNVMHESVPYGEDGSQNVVVQTFGNKPTFTFTPKNHTEIIEQLGIVDLERAAKVSGARFFFLKGDLAILEFALEQYALEFMINKGYVPVTPPHMLKRDAYEGVTDLGAFEEMIYKVEGEDLYLIATSEHPLTAMFKDEVLDASSMPLKMVGISPCYRKEAGSHGKEEKASGECTNSTR